MSNANMIKRLITALFCLVLSACSSPRYSDRAKVNFHEAKARVDQLRTGMPRTEVEAILQAMTADVVAFCKEWQ